MTTLDELERAVERLNRAVERLSSGMGKYGFANVYNDDVQLLLSERAKLLATVERMRACLRTISKRAGQLFEQSEKLRANDARAVRRIADFADAAARAALTTGESTTPNAGERG